MLANATDLNDLQPTRVFIALAELRETLLAGLGDLGPGPWSVAAVAAWYAGIAADLLVERAALECRLASCAAVASTPHQEHP